MGSNSKINFSIFNLKFFGNISKNDTTKHFKYTTLSVAHNTLNTQLLKSKEKHSHSFTCTSSCQPKIL